MKLFRFSRFFAFASLALAAAAIFIAHAVDRVATTCTAVYRLACDFVASGLKLAARGDGVGFARPAMLQVQARAFVLRLAKRDRPRLTPGWRMCPST